MQSIRQSCHPTLLACKSSAAVVNGSRRAFSRSAACQRGALPQFLEPSSPDLSAVLAKLNSKILLPQHLNKEQQDLVYKKVNRPRLEAEPIEITLGDVTLPLEHIDRGRAQPARWETIKTILNNSQTAEDWENVVRMMEGFHNAGIDLKPRWTAKIVRNMGLAGMPHLVLKSLQRAGSTGLRLRDLELVEAVLTAMRDKAVRSDWNEADTNKALGWIEQVIELMEEKEHLGKQEAGPSDPRASPLVIAYPLEQAAVRAKHHLGGEDSDGKVMKYAVRLMNALTQNPHDSVIRGDLIKEISTRRAPESFRSTRNRVQANSLLKHRILSALPLWNALRLSGQVLEANMPMADTAQELTKELEDALEAGQQRLDEEMSPRLTINRLGYVGTAIKGCAAL